LRWERDQKKCFAHIKVAGQNGTYCKKNFFTFVPVPGNVAADPDPGKNSDPDPGSLICTVPVLSEVFYTSDQPKLSNGSSHGRKTKCPKRTY
jgi:hypothetical protein